MNSIYALIEPAIVGGGVLVALGFALRRFVPRLRGGASGGCSSCSNCGGCGSTVPAAPVAGAPPKPIVLHRQARRAVPSAQGVGIANTGFPPARE
jgi:hypothetical protein